MSRRCIGGAISVHKAQQRRMASRLPRAVQEERCNLLHKIYAPPFARLEKGSSEYEQLARSGAVWEEYHRPGDGRAMGYLKLQKELMGVLAEIDKLKVRVKRKLPNFAKARVIDHVHQSISIEASPLTIPDSIFVHGQLQEAVFNKHDLASMSLSELKQLGLPEIQLDQKHPSDVTELRNHLVLSRWIAERAPRFPRTAGLGESEVQELAAMTIKGTDSETVCTSSWGGVVPLGGYRRLPVASAFNPLRVYAYPSEVPACMNRFFEWRNREHEHHKHPHARHLHPLLLACQMSAYFSHIHPFPDGNGRVCRMMVHDYMVRQGYLPIVLHNFQRQRYLQMMSDAQDGRPVEFVMEVVGAQRAALHQLT